MNCVKHHIRKRDNTIRCHTCKEFGHLAKNCMNTSRVEDEKKSKVDKIRKKMRQQWIPKSTEDTNPSNVGQVTQELGDSTTYN